MNSRTSIELSRAAFSYNIEQIKKAAGSAVAVVIKSNAYGHGIQEIAQLAQDDPNVAWLCTAGIAEALLVRQQGITKPLIALSYLDDNLEDALRADIHVGLYNLEDAAALNAAAQSVGKKAFVHIKVDTGMSRLGILPEHTLHFIRTVQEFPHIELYGLFTHLCDTPNPDQTFSYAQLKKFDELIEMLHAAGITIPCIHAQSSSALSLKPNYPYTFIRAGAAAYGIRKSQAHQDLIKKLHPSFDLKPVMQWKTRVIHIKKIPAGAFVGYDKTWVAQRPTLLAIAPIGYYDGYSRGLSNRGHALINHHYAPVAGIVSMNITAFDVTDCEEVKIGDEIILLADASELSAVECARSAHIITNELVTHIHSSIERIIVPEHKPVIIHALLQEKRHGLKDAIKPSTRAF